MRDIKFRAWHKELLDMTYAPKPPITLERFFWKMETYGDMYVVMQYTGLKDKNGKEIYEGDICFAESKEYPRNKQVIWNEELARFEFDYPLGKSLLSTDSIEVIGNIYENPELLNQRKKDETSVATGAE